MTHRFELYEPLTSLNQTKGRHWTHRHRHKRHMTTALLAAGARENILPNHRQLVTITRLKRPRQRDYDHDNLVAGNAKALIDALTDLGYWRDDNPYYLRREYHQRAATPDEIARGIHAIIEIEPDESPF